MNMMMVMIRMRNEDEKGDVNEDRLFLGNNLMMIIFIIMVMIMMMTMAMLMKKIDPLGRGHDGHFHGHDDDNAGGSDKGGEK